jgi:isopentenyl-diphosphate delta-isomerase
MPEVTDTSQRKADHIRINLEENVQFPTVTTGLENYRFMHSALPEMNLDAVDTRVEVFGHTLASPVFISSMTGGTDKARTINLRLAEAAQNHNLAMGVGSQRALIEDPSLLPTFDVRSTAPDVLLFGNVGAVQLNYGYTAEHCQRAVELIEADALILHLNVLQEAVQPEGDTLWAGLLPKIEAVTKALDVPVIAKEVGWGISAETAQQLFAAGVSAIDVAGSGGTSWSQVEYHRAPTAFHAKVAAAFADWGIPTAESVQMVRSVVGRDFPVFASGGIRDGIDVAKSVALGATLVGFAGVMLRAADQSPDALDETIRIIQRQLEIAMMCSGAATIPQLRLTPLHEV